MIIAQEKKQKNIAEYILYMFQLEDMMRACKFDKSIIEQNVVNKFQVDTSKRAEISSWYSELVLAMKDQGLEKAGHLSYLTSLMSELSAFNVSVLQINDDAQYAVDFNNSLPALTEIVQKSKGSISNEVEAAFTMLYGVLVLRMKGEKISDGTSDALEKVSTFVRGLAKKYHKQNDSDN